MSSRCQADGVYQPDPVELTGFSEIHSIFMATTEAAAGESFAALFEESLARKEMRVGEVITAEVIRKIGRAHV